MNNGETWDYARMAMEAKQHGGPDALYDYLLKLGYNKGSQDALLKNLLFMLIASGAALLTSGAVSLVKHFRSKKEEKKDLEKVKEILEKSDPRFVHIQGFSGDEKLAGDDPEEETDMNNLKEDDL